MPTEPTNPVDPQPVEPKPARQPRSAQDRKQAREIAAIGQTLSAVIADASAPGLIADSLAEGSFDLAELQRGQSLQVAAARSLSEHLAALGAQDAATKAYGSAQNSLSKLYSTLRGLARSALLKNSDALTALKLDGREPRDLTGLINAVNALLDNAALPAYADRLTRRAVTPAKLQNLRAKLAAFQLADNNQEEAKAAAPRATRRRDEAADALKAWFAEFKAFVKVQFKDQPDVLKSWGLK